jgi:transposase
MKGYLKSRPMFHWTDNRIIGHLMLSFLSHFCEAHLTKRLREKGVYQESKSIKEGIVKRRPLTVPAAMEQLSLVRAVPVKIKKENLWLRTDIPPNGIKLIKAIGMKILAKILSK